MFRFPTRLGSHDTPATQMKSYVMKLLHLSGFKTTVPPFQYLIYGVLGSLMVKTYVLYSILKIWSVTNLFLENSNSLKMKIYSSSFD